MIIQAHTRPHTGLLLL